MCELFLFYFTVLGLAYGFVAYFFHKRGDRLRCVAWGTRLHVGCAYVLYLLLCFQPDWPLSQAARGHMETVIGYSHALLFGSPHS